MNMLKVSCCFQHELAKKILLENPGSKSESQNFRISRARHIFELGQEKEALRIIIESKHTEPHHLIPLSAHRDFPGIDLDREQNIVSLCSNCHNLLHYGASYKEVLYELYIQRRELLKQIGIMISFEQLLRYY